MILVQEIILIHRSAFIDHGHDALIHSFIFKLGFFIRFHLTECFRLDLFQVEITRNRIYKVCCKYQLDDDRTVVF